MNPLIKYINVDIKHLKINPWKLKIMGSERDQEKLDWLEGSIKEWDFGPGLVGRVVDNNGKLVQIDKDTDLKVHLGIDWYIELANGGHRLDQLIAMKWADKVHVALQNLSNVEMLRKMASDNHYTTFSPKERVGIIKEAHKILTEHPEICRRSLSKPDTPNLKRVNCQHGSAQCISSFLGASNWPRPRIFELLSHAGIKEEDNGDIVNSWEEKHAPISTPISTGPISLLPLPTEQLDQPKNLANVNLDAVEEVARESAKNPTTVNLDDQVNKTNADIEKELNGSKGLRGAKEPLTGKKRAESLIKSLKGTETTYADKWKTFSKTFTDLSAEDLKAIRQELTRLGLRFTEMGREIPIS
jgi:hypothetical protein